MTYFNVLPKDLHTLLLDGFQKCYIVYNCTSIHYDNVMIAITSDLTTAVKLVLEMYGVVVTTSRKLEDCTSIHNKYENDQWSYAIDSPEPVAVCGYTCLIVEFSFNENLMQISDKLWTHYCISNKKLVKFYTHSHKYRRGLHKVVKSYQKDYAKDPKYETLFVDDEFKLNHCPLLDKFDFSKFDKYLQNEEIEILI